MAPEPPPSEKRTARDRASESWSNLSRAGKWVVAVVLAAAIGAPVGALSTDLLVPDDGPEPSTTSTEGSRIFGDKFSNSGAQRWKDDADVDSPGGQYVAEAYQLSAERGVDRWGVLASPNLKAENVRLTVEAHRTGGTAQDGFGYGLFCRADGLDQQASLYAFTIWKNHAVIEKRVDGRIVEKFGTDATITAEVEDDDLKELQAVCTTSSGGGAVDLEFWVDGGGSWDPHQILIHLRTAFLASSRFLARARGTLKIRSTSNSTTSRHGRQRALCQSDLGSLI